MIDMMKFNSTTALMPKIKGLRLSRRYLPATAKEFIAIIAAKGKYFIMNLMFSSLFNIPF